MNGFLVEFGNEKALKTALLKLINDKKLCEEMGGKGREIINKHFTSEIINVQTFNIWSEIT